MSKKFTELCDSKDRAKWLEKRREGIGSSDAPGVLGLSPWSSPLAVYADKAGLVPPDEEMTEAMRWGQILEPVIIAEFSKETGREVHLGGQLYRSAEHPFMLATLDAVIPYHPGELRGPGVLEIKATAYRQGDWDEGVPDHVYVQGQHQLAVTGFAWITFCVLLGGARLRWVDVPRDDAFIAKLVDAEAEFWRRVEAREPVNPDGSAATREALRALYPKDNGETIALPGELIPLDAELVEIKAQLAAFEARKREIENGIRAAIGPATVGVLANGVTYTHRLQQRAEHIVKASEFRVLRRQKAKESAV